MYFQQIYRITSLIHYLVNTYYAHLSSVLIVYDSNSSSSNTLQQQYLDNVQQAFENQLKNGNIIGLQWINIQYINDNGEDLGEQILSAVDIVPVEGFITILENTSQFLHARYYATRYSTLRLKDKIYLFLCGSEEKAKDFLASEILQFYPHHLMVKPETIYPESTNDYIKKGKNEITAQGKHQDRNIKQIRVAKRLTSKNLKVANVTNTTTAKVTSLASSFLYFFNGNVDDAKNYNKRRDINFELWTQQYVGAEGNLNAIQLDTYISSNGTFSKNAQLYPNKLLNLQQRTMRIGSLTYVPYVKTNYVPPGQGDVDSIDSKGPSKTVKFVGAEAELMKTFCQVYNCHLRVEPYGGDNWGVINENGTAEGMLGDLYKQHMEMAIGCLFNWYNDITETSQFIARSSVTILGPEPEHFPHWRIIILPFSKSLWLTLVVTMIMCSTMFHFIKYASNGFKYMHLAKPNKYRSCRSIEKCLLDIFAVFIQQPSANTALNRSSTRIFLAFLLCATLTLENIYSGHLKSLLTMPLFNEPIDNMHKWSLTGWKWAAPSIIWVSTVENSDLPMEQHLVHQFEVRDYEFLYNATFWNNYGLGLERVYSGSFSFGEYIRRPALESKIVLKDDLYFDWTRAVAIRGWPFMPLLDGHILHILETGIYIYWETQSSYKFLDHHVQDILKMLSSSSKPKSPPQILSIQHISGPIFILIYGYLMAFIVFIIEILCNRVKGVGRWKNVF